jgi:hypothetical protein
MEGLSMVEIQPMSWPVIKEVVLLQALALPSNMIGAFADATVTTNDSYVDVERRNGVALSARYRLWYLTVSLISRLNLKLCGLRAPRLLSPWLNKLISSGSAGGFDDNKKSNWWMLHRRDHVKGFWRLTKPP